MRRMTGVWSAGSGMLLAVMLFGYFLPGLLGLSTTAAWILRTMLWVLGGLATGLVVYYLRARARSLPEAAPVDEEVDAVIGGARRRLPGTAKLGRLPVILVLGGRGSAKTTIVLHSGLEPELLAGEVQRGVDVVHTEVANLWLASDAIFAEAGEKLMNDPPRWVRLLRHLQPSRLAAVFAKGRQAPRLALVCFPCDELARPGALDSVVAAAQQLRARLSEAANQFGIRLPVYVLFTKADQVPFFPDFVRNLTADEASEVLGATLPLAGLRDSGHYREEETARSDAAFDGIFHGLALRRPALLVRETAEDVRAGAYEFPRELRKVSTVATRFLVELCRPSQTGSAPFLRGFYFTGVRPVMVRDTRDVGAPLSAPGGAFGGATSIFDPRAMMASAPVAQSGGGSRRVPEWTFLPRLLRDVVLADRVAMGLTGGGARVNLLRRVALGTATAALLILTGAFVTSFVANRRLVSEALAAAEGVRGVDLSGLGMPPLEDLTRLDAVRSVAARLRTWESGRPPGRYRWGLYRGSETLASLRLLYFSRFERVLWESTRERMVVDLGSIPETPTAASDYTSTFEALRAYIITTDHPEYSTPEFMTPVLMRYVPGGQTLDEERTRLARLQLDFYASDLPYGNPYDRQPDTQLLSRTRSYLAQFGDTDRLYQALVNEASRQAAAVSFHEAVPGAEEVLKVAAIVPGAFTVSGWGFVQANVGNVDRFFASDSWVLGDQTVSAADRARIAIDLRQRYERDYVRVWTEFLASAAVPAYANASDAARRLLRLSDNRSPLLQLLAITSSNTAVDTLVVGRAFQPVHAVVPPNVSDRFIQPSNESYVSGLGQLARTMEQVAAAPGAAQQAALMQAQGDADRVSGSVRQMAQGFGVGGDAGSVGVALQRLLQQPVERLLPLVARIPAAETNAKGASFCSALSPVLGKYPFSPGASVQATLEEVNAVFQPGASALATLVSGLQDVLVRQGAEYRARPGAERAPTAEFLNMLNQAARISDALYATGASVPTVQFTVQPSPTEALPEVLVTVDGSNHTVTRTDFQRRSFTWSAATSREARISARVADGTTVPLVAYDGTWATFRLFGQAQWSEVAAGVYRLTWNVNPGGTLMAELSFPQRTPIFSSETIGAIRSCVSTVVR